MSNKVEKWSKWLDVIGVQIHNMLIKQDTHNTILKMIAGNRALHQQNLFYDHLFHTYIAYILVSLRRQLKRENNSISLRGLLFDMSENKDVIPMCKCVSVDPDEDIKKMKQLSADIEDYVDKRLAHTDKRHLKKIPNPNEIEDCIFMMKDIHKKYSLVINKHDIELMPMLYEWDNIFRIPWIEEK